MSQSAITILTADHDRVKALFKQYEALGPRARAKRKAIVEEIIREVVVHSGLEESLFYPAARARGAEDIVLESLEEHHIVEWTLNELSHMEPEDERWEAKVKVLRENLAHHIEEEEGEMFPKVASAVSPAELRTLGEQIEAMRLAMPTHPHPKAPDTPPGNLLAAAAAKPMEMAMDAVKAAVTKNPGVRATSPRTPTPRPGARSAAKSKR